MNRRTTGLALTMVVALIQLSCGEDAVGEGDNVASDDSASGDAESEDVAGQEGRGPFGIFPKSDFALVVEGGYLAGAGPSTVSYHWAFRNTSRLELEWMHLEFKSYTYGGAVAAMPHFVRQEIDLLQDETAIIWDDLRGFEKIIHVDVTILAVGRARGGDVVCDTERHKQCTWRFSVW